ncbi:DUF805 domain-containing protein [Pseudomonas sp. CCI3.2]|uniref:DUF805 domain-containing protein n=1 Tax=unclassified Pseudomonas TaxID=196821 RepID=UPI002AC9CF51|nr:MULTISPECIES: DUF805 domain-containing protein [unclassified Pseudomonas]MEB0080177.1 DUF805 domain-containing protein [Pseudomonas sp. MH10out]MEB0094183.1 DUF805 domain-containing protein [Pseudomonas sp. CCI4.2]MEB0104179.1 DUF805 domain-containing protein [Pseudomonas sp. CCI3.2]MEB0123397.1 DUF805 domain-containing protein [Pseudomonas sp. CCI1.2]MEB0133322.1 DUF805 domain-containing protein [Pseudomonas sp. CCI2.4]
MADPHFKIIFNGQLRNGVERETASLNLTELFKSDASIVEKLFSGRAATLKHGLSHEQALRYLEALHEAGVEAHIEVESPVSATSDDTHQSPSYRPQIEPSPYAPPQAPVVSTLEGFSELKVFSVQGRIGRLRYLAWSLVLMVSIGVAAAICAALMTSSLIAGGLLTTIAVVAFIIISVQIGAQRLHDAGWSAWLLLLNIVPFVGTLFPILMMVVPGNAGANEYGAPQPPNSKTVKILACIWLLILALGTAGFFVGGLGLFENEVQTTATEYENTLPYDDDNDNDAAQPADSTPPSVDYKDK